MTRGVQLGLRVLGSVALVAYPMLAYYGVTRLDTRGAALVMLAVLAPVAVSRLPRLSDVNASAIRGVAFAPLLVVGLLGLGAALNTQGYVLAAPVAIACVLLAAFGVTLRPGSVPMIERFARLQVSDLSPAERRWCRGWTVAWCAFFLANGTTALVLALWAPLEWWTVYNGLIAYALMGLLFAGEYVPRKLRFGRWGTGPVDRLLLKLWPRARELGQEASRR